MPHALAAGPGSPSPVLSQVIPSLDVDGLSMQRVMDYLRKTSGTNLTVNWKALEEVGVTKETVISLRVREVTLRKVLQLVLDLASPNSPLTYVIDGNVIEVTSQEAQDKILITKVYVVDDLVMVNNQNIQPPRLNLSSLTSGGGSSGGGGGGGFGGGGGGGGGGSSQGLFTQSTQTQQPQQTAAQKGQELVSLIKLVVRPNIWSDAGGTSTITFLNGKLIVYAPASVHEAIGGPVGKTAIRYGN